MQVHLTTKQPSNKRAILKLKGNIGGGVSGGRMKNRSKRERERDKGCGCLEERHKAWYLSKLNRDLGIDGAAESRIRRELERSPL